MTPNISKKLLGFLVATIIPFTAATRYGQAQTQQTKPQPEANVSGKRNPKDESERILLKTLQQVLGSEGIHADNHSLDRREQSKSFHSFVFSWEAYLNAPALVEVNDTRYQQGKKLEILSKISGVGSQPHSRSVLSPCGGLFVVGISNHNHLLWWVQIADPRTVLGHDLQSTGELKTTLNHRSKAEFFVDVPDDLGIAELRFYVCQTSSGDCHINLINSMILPATK